MHYKKSSWYQEIDPAFNQIIKIYMKAFQKMQLPAREGYLALALDGKDYNKIETEGFPSVASLYEHDKPQDIVNDIGLMFGNGITKEKIKEIEKEVKKKYNFYSFLLPVINSLENASRDYYLKSLAPFSAVESFKTYISNMDEKTQKKLLMKMHSDTLSFIWHVGMLDIDSLRKDKEKCEAVKEIVKKHRRFVKRTLFFVWDVISLLVNRKPLKQLFTEARKGDDNSLFELIKVDKTLFDHEWVRTRIRKAMYSGDKNFFNSLGIAIMDEPLKTEYDNLDIAIILLTFWKAGLYRLTVRQTMQLLLDSDVHFKQGETSFNQIRVRLRPFLKI